MSETNIWGTLKSDVGEGFCKDCERAVLEGHYDTCPQRRATWLTAARRIVDTQTGDLVDGTLLDLFSASVLVQVHDALSEPNRAKFTAMPLAKAHRIAFQLANRSETARG